MKLSRLTKSWIIDLLLIAVIAVGLYAAINFQQFDEVWLTPLKQIVAEDLELWIANSIQWMHDTATGITFRILLMFATGMGVLFLIGWRLIWRIRESHRFAGTDCPQCGYPLSRIRRTDLQRKISKVIPIRRFYCKKCRWKGLRLKSNNPTPLDVQNTSVKPKPPEKIDLG